MVDFTVHAQRLSAGVDLHLGDRLLYAIGGADGGDYVEQMGRLLEAEPTPSYNRMDESKGGWRLRIAKARVPKPTTRDRVQCDAILGAGTTWRPTSSQPVDAGIYWLIDLQRV